MWELWPFFDWVKNRKHVNISSRSGDTPAAMWEVLLVLDSIVSLKERKGTALKAFPYS